MNKALSTGRPAMGIYEVKSRKGLIRAKCRGSGGVIAELDITGDFFMYPEDLLWRVEEELIGVRIDYDEIYRRLDEIFRSLGIVLIGSRIDDFVRAIHCACSGGCGD